MKKFIIAGLLSIITVQLWSQCLLDQEPPKQLVVDGADIFNSSQEQQLESELVRFNNETSNQILVVTVEDLCGYDKAEFTYTLGEKWHVGQKKFDNGIVIMIKPHGKAGDRHVFIAVGYGLEGAIPDAISKRIVEVEMIPNFKQGDFYSGVTQAVSTLEGLAKGEIDVKQYGKSDKKIPVLPIILVFLIIGFTIFNAVRRVQRHAIGRDMSFWTAMWLLGSMNRRHTGHWGNFNSGGGGFGGGGFGGFGGGSFGGGGAGGSW